MTMANWIEFASIKQTVPLLRRYWNITGSTVCGAAAKINGAAAARCMAAKGGILFMSTRPSSCFTVSRAAPAARCWTW